MVLQSPSLAEIKLTETSVRVSGRMSKLPRGEAVGPLSQRETEVVAELLHRAIVREECNAVISKIASHTHGKHVAVHAKAVVEEIQGMSDASKRRLEAESEIGSWDHVISDEEEFDPSCMPMSSAGYSKENPNDKNLKIHAAQTMRDSHHPEVPLPPKVKDVNQWSRTIVSMKKYADFNVMYGELTKLAKTDTEASKYLGWIQKTYTPEARKMKTVKRTQAVDMAMLLKKIGWSMYEPEEFVRMLK
eukprot:s345_g25.t1